MSKAMNNWRKAALYLKKALVTEFEGNLDDVDKWLNKAAAAESAAVESGEVNPNVAA